MDSRKIHDCLTHLLISFVAMSDLSASERRELTQYDFDNDEDVVKLCEEQIIPPFLSYDAAMQSNICLAVNHIVAGKYAIDMEEFFASNLIDIAPPADTRRFFSLIHRRMEGVCSKHADTIS